MFSVGSSLPRDSGYSSWAVFVGCDFSVRSFLDESRELARGSLLFLQIRRVFFRLVFVAGLLSGISSSLVSWSLS